MGLTHWFDRTRMQIRRYGYRRGVRASLRAIQSGVVARACRLVPNQGEYIYDFDWDALVVLDACRVDALAAVAPEYDFLPDSIPSVYSRASMSETWLEQNFTEAFRSKIEKTAYVSANGHTKGFETGEFKITHSDFAHLETVSEYAFDESLGTIPPRPVTDYTVQYLRNDSPGRVVVHYMQPHTPYRGLELDGHRGDDSLFRENVWDRLHVGELDEEEVWDYYIDNLRWVLDDVALLLENMDRETVVITADHGECFGERGMYGHPRHGRVDALRRVPWVKTTAVDNGTHTAKPVDPETETTSLEEQLEALGYQ